MTVFARFSDEFPEREETRILVLIDRASGKEADRLNLDEHFCADPECDCRRVMLAVHDGHERLATIMVDFVGGPGRTPRGENPYLEPAIEQPDGAEEVLAYVRAELDRDAAYRERLIRHYEEMKQRMRDPAHPLWPAIIEDRRMMTRVAESLVRSFAPAFAGPSRDRRERNRRKRRRKRK